MIKLFKDAIELWGADSQIKMMFEEMAELIKALCKLDRGNGSSPEKILHVCEEITDVEIVLEQMKLIFGNEEYRNSVKNQKLNRLKDKVEKEKKKRSYDKVCPIEEEPKEKYESEYIDLIACISEGYCLYKHKMYSECFHETLNEEWMPICDDQMNECPDCPYKHKFLFRQEDLDKAMFSCLW